MSFPFLSFRKLHTVSHGGWTNLCPLIMYEDSLFPMILHLKNLWWSQTSSCLPRLRGVDSLGPSPCILTLSTTVLNYPVFSKRGKLHLTPDIWPEMWIAKNSSAQEFGGGGLESKLTLRMGRKSGEE